MKGDKSIKIMQVQVSFGNYYFFSGRLKVTKKTPDDFNSFSHIQNKI